MTDTFDSIVLRKKITRFAFWQIAACDLMCKAGVSGISDNVGSLGTFAPGNTLTDLINQNKGHISRLIFKLQQFHLVSLVSIPYLCLNLTVCFRLTLWSMEDTVWICRVWTLTSKQWEAVAFHLVERCCVREVISHIRVMNFCVFCPVFLRVPSAHFTVLLFWQEDVYVGWGVHSLVKYEWPVVFT